MLLRLLPSVQILNQGTVADMTAKTVLRAPYRSPSPANTQGDLSLGTPCTLTYNGVA